MWASSEPRGTTDLPLSGHEVVSCGAKKLKNIGGQSSKPLRTAMISSTFLLALHAQVFGGFLFVAGLFALAAECRN